MNKILLIGFCLLMTSCTIVTRGQSDAFINQADLINQRIELNERQIELLKDNLGGDHPSIRIIEQNTELFRISEQQLRVVFE